MARDGDTDAKSNAKKRRSKAERAHDSKNFAQARTRAERLLRDPEAAAKLADQAEGKVNDKQRGALSKVVEEIKALVRLVRAYVTGEYRAMSWESMVLIVGALIYLVSPIDVIPDLLPGGLVDDAAVVAFVLGLVRAELLDYMDWEASRTEDDALRAAA